MILNNRKFERELPTRSAKHIFIIAEGAKREYQYFNFFREIDSRIKIEVYKLRSDEDNSPGGLLDIAEKITTGVTKQCLVEEGDELWVVFDTDLDKFNSRTKQIQELRERCTNSEGWNIAQSNPCFEVWLYFHFKKVLPNLSNIALPNDWKREVNQMISGGFDSRKHPIHIEQAQVNAEAILLETGGISVEGNTEICSLAKSILEVIKDKIDKLRSIL